MLVVANFRDTVTRDLLHTICATRTKLLRLIKREVSFAYKKDFSDTSTRVDRGIGEVSDAYKKGLDRGSGFYSCS